MIKIILIIMDESEQHEVKARLPFEDGFEVIGMGKDAYDAIKLVGSKKPDIVIMDICFEDGDGIELVPLLKNKSPQTSIIFFDTVEDADRVCKFIAYEASGYLIKSRDMDILSYVVREVYRGGCFLSPDAASKAMPLISQMVRQSGGIHKKAADDSHTGQTPSLFLSGIELQITIFIAKGFSTKEIAEKLSITEGTVRNYVSAVMQKAGVQNRSRLTVFAIQNRLINL